MKNKLILQLIVVALFSVVASGCVPLAIGAGAGVGYELAKG